MEKVGVEVSYPVTADMFENPEDDLLATAQFRADQGKEMDQWISNDVIRHSQSANHDDALG